MAQKPVAEQGRKAMFALFRDRPFNLKGGGGYGFLFRSEFFFRTTRELEYVFFSSRKARNFLPEFNIRLYGLMIYIFLCVIFCMCFVLFMISIIVNIEYMYIYMLYDIG